MRKGRCEWDATNTERRNTRNTNVISLRSYDPDQLDRDWERNVVSQLVENARYYKALLATKPSIKMVLDIWFMQRDDFDLLTQGTADPKLFQRRKSALEKAEGRMDALLDQIIDLYQERRAVN